MRFDRTSRPWWRPIGQFALPAGTIVWLANRISEETGHGSHDVLFMVGVVLTVVGCGFVFARLVTCCR